MDIKVITTKEEAVAKEIVLQGLEERFGFLDPTLNPDLNNIITNYLKEGSIFLIGKEENDLVCTGALFKEDNNTGRIQRMSVKSTCRGKGYARKILETLEGYAKEFGYSKLVLETNNDWHSAISLYTSSGYECYENDGECSHFFKVLK